MTKAALTGRPTAFWFTRGFYPSKSDTTPDRRENQVRVMGFSTPGRCQRVESRGVGSNDILSIAKNRHDTLLSWVPEPGGDTGGDAPGPGTTGGLMTRLGGGWLIRGEGPPRPTVPEVPFRLLLTL